MHRWRVFQMFMGNKYNILKTMQRKIDTIFHYNCPGVLWAIARVVHKFLCHPCLLGSDQILSRGWHCFHLSPKMSLMLTTNPSFVGDSLIHPFWMCSSCRNWYSRGSCRHFSVNLSNVNYNCDKGWTGKSHGVGRPQKWKRWSFHATKELSQRRWCLNPKHAGSAWKERCTWKKTKSVQKPCN